MAKKVTPGQPFRPSARQWNEFVDAARTLQTDELNQAFDVDLPEHSQTKILVKNESGSELPRFSILALGEPWKTPEEDLPQFKRQIVFRGVVPQTYECHQPKHPYVILLEPLQPDGIGEAVLAGIVITQVNVIREIDPFAEVVEGNTTSLRSVPHGRTRILWKEPGTGLKWCVVRISDRPRFAVFELPTTKWKTGDAGAYPPEPDGWAKMSGCKPVFYFADDFTYVADGNEDPETIWHQVGYPAKERDDVIALHTSTGLWPAKFGEKDWVWCFWNDHECRWQILASYEDHWRFQLLEPLQRCGSASAKLVLYDGVYCPVDLTFTVVDSIGIIWPEDEAGSSGGPVVIPAGTYGIAKHFADSDKWEVMVLGEGCCPKSSSSSGSSPSSSPSSSLSSPSSKPSSPSSKPSSELPPSSVPSSTPSSTPSSEPSSKPSSQPSETSPSEPPSSIPSQPPSESPASLPSQQSDKSTAIVPASWSPTGYTALFIAEMPEVRFDDVMTATVVEDETLLPIDRRFLEVCEPNCLQVCGCVPDLPIPVGAVVENDTIRVRLGARSDEQSVNLVIRLTGIRKGFRSQRFPNRTEEQFLANEAFIRSAYPGGDE
jgi:hypothetical protein